MLGKLRWGDLKLGVDAPVRCAWVWFGPVR